jgi:ribosomal protein S18 acetylase RimI-like enzyme
MGDVEEERLMMEEESDTLLRLTKKDILPGAVTLAKAFQDYPLTRWLVPDESTRLKTQSRGFRGTVQGGIQYGEVYATSAKMEGLAIWYFPGEQWEPQQRKFSPQRWFSSLFADRERMRRVRSWVDYANGIRKHVVPGRHLYLQILGVDPDYQGQGYASRLLKPMLTRADREGLPCFLDTEVEKNVKLYEHFGFKVEGEGLVPGSNVHSWAMVRKNEVTSSK